MEITVAHQHPAALEPLLPGRSVLTTKTTTKAKACRSSQHVRSAASAARGARQSPRTRWRVLSPQGDGACVVLRRRRIDLVDYFDHFLVTLMASGRERKTIADWVISSARHPRASYRSR